MNTLDGIALNIELVLISIIEGVALSALALSAAPVFQSPQNWQYIPFVLAGLCILVVFWSQAILHAISFIRWPLSMGHMFTYFFAAFLQAVAYYSITQGVSWYFWWTIFSFLVCGIYIIDYRILKRVASGYDSIPGGTLYIQNVTKRHIFEMKFLVPLSLLFNAGAFSLSLYGGPHFSGPHFWIIAGSLQFLISLGALVNCVQNFNERSEVLWKLFENPVK